MTLRNPIIKAATFEGMARHCLVTDALVDYHEAVASGGVGMTTLAYCAVSDDGRGAPGEIVVTDAAVPGLARLVETVHGHGAAASIQLGHAGPVAAGTGHRGLGAPTACSSRRTSDRAPASGGRIGGADTPADDASIGAR